MTQRQEEIEIEFKSGDLEYIDAVGELEKIGFKPLDAEAIVAGWEEDMGGVKS